MARILAAVALAILPGVGPTAAGEKQALDADFLLKASPQCHAFVKYSELAEKRATSDAVKELGRKLVKDHHTVHQELAKAAQNQKIVVVAGTEKSTRDEINRLAKLEGIDFDKAFLGRIIEDHEKAIKMFQAQAEQGNDVKLRNFAKSSLPALRGHLKQAKELTEKIGK